MLLISSLKKSLSAIIISVSAVCAATIIVIGIYFCCKNAKAGSLYENAPSQPQPPRDPSSQLNQNEEVNEDNRPLFPIAFAEPIRNDQIGNGGSSESILQADVVVS